MKRILILISLFFLSACTTPSASLPAESRTPQFLGNPQAKVQIEEFSDFQCPACGAISPLVEDIVSRNATTMGLTFRHFPLSQHPFAFRAAEAAECAGDQGKFWEFAAIAFKNQKKLAEEELLSFADQLKLDKEAFGTCFGERQKKSLVTFDLYEANRRQLPGTPTFFVNGKMVQFSKDFETYLKSL